jgi:hypothetical protein
LAYLCGSCNYEQRAETQRLRLRIRRSQVRVLPSAPRKSRDLQGKSEMEKKGWGDSQPF